jgi:HEAT repeats
MIERVIGAFNHLGFDLDDTEIADILWLGVQMRRCDPSPISELPQETPAAASKIDPNTKLPRDRQNNFPKSPTKTETSAKVYPQSSQDSSQTSSGLPIKVSTAQALRNKLDISRSLKPLKRRFPSRSEFILDEIATAERIAEEKLLLPVMCPARDRWLEVALVVDEGTSMFLWQQTIKEFQQLLERHGAFRDVRTWGLFTDRDNKVWLRPRTGKLSHQKKLHNPRELIDPNGRRLFIMISDCVSKAWYNGAITKTLAAWASTAPTTIIQVLPEWLGSRSALGAAESILLRSLAPGVPNHQLIMTALDLFDEWDVCNKLKIPVVTLEPESLKNWARMVAGAPDVQTKGFLLASDGEILDSSESTENSPVELTAKQRLQRFRLTASPMARKLAGLLAAAPVSLPVVRLIQQTMLDKSSQVHVAEVFLGGILKPLSPVDEDGEADKIQFDFADGVRDLLLDGLPLTESTEVLRKVSEYIAARVGLSVDDFTAMLLNPGLGDRSSGALVRPFAQTTAKVLRRLGGKYTELAEEIEQFYHESSQIDISIQEAIKALNDNDCNVRSNAAYTLGEIGREKAVDALIKALNDEDINVLNSVIYALGKIGGKSAVDALIDVLNDEDLDVRSSVVKALGYMDTGNRELNSIIGYLHNKIEEDAFIDLLTENYYSVNYVEELLSATYRNDYLDFESFVELAIQTLKPDFDGKVYVIYNRYYSTHDEGERIVIPQEIPEFDQIYLSQVPKFIADTDGESLGVNLEHEQEIEMVLAILISGECDIPDSDIEEGTVEISIKEPEFIDDSDGEDEGNVDFGEATNSEQSVGSNLTTDFDDIF